MTKKELIKRLNRKFLDKTTIRAIRVEDSRFKYNVGDLLFYHNSYNNEVVNRYFILGFCSRKTWYDSMWKKHYIIKISSSNFNPGFSSPHRIIFFNQYDFEKMTISKSVNNILKKL